MVADDCSAAPSRHGAGCVARRRALGSLYYRNFVHYFLETCFLPARFRSPLSGLLSLCCSGKTWEIQRTWRMHTYPIMQDAAHKSLSTRNQKCKGIYDTFHTWSIIHAYIHTLPAPKSSNSLFPVPYSLFPNLHRSAPYPTRSATTCNPSNSPFNPPLPTFIAPFLANALSFASGTAVSNKTRTAASGARPSIEMSNSVLG